MTKILHIGVVGLKRGMSVARAVHHHPDCTVTAVCDLDGVLADKAAAELGAEPYESFADMLGADMHAVVVATPPSTHTELACETARAGKHVLSEVPAVAALDEAEQLRQTVERAGVTYMLAENMCYFGNIKTLEGIVRSGRIGEVFYAEGEYVHNCRSLFTDRPDGLGGGTDGRPTWRVALPPIHYCTHEMGPLFMMTGDPITEAVCMPSGSHVDARFGALDMQAALFKTQSGGTVKFLCGFSIEREPSFHFLSLYGTKGSAETDRYRPYENIKAYFTDIPHTRDLIDIPVSLNRPDAPPQARVGGHGTSEFYMVEDFVRRVRTGADTPLGVSEALNISVPGICAQMSAERNGAPVSVPVY